MRCPSFLLLLALLIVGCGGGGAPASRSRAELTNPFLGPDYTAWAVGPVARIATPEEIQAVPGASGRHPGRGVRPGFLGPPRSDRRTSRATPSGRPSTSVPPRPTASTARPAFWGAAPTAARLYVVYGPPTKSEFEVSPVPGGSPLEVWTYDASAPSGLDARRPAGLYRFIKQGDRTVLYAGGRQPTSLLQPTLQEPPL